MKTSKIKEVHSCKPFTGQNGTTYYHNLTMENGDEINIGKKKEQSVGEELTYELTGGDDGQQRFKKAKSVNPQQQQTGGGKFQGADQDAILFQVALKGTCDLMAKAALGGVPNEEDVANYALKLAQLSKANIQKLKQTN